LLAGWLACLLGLLAGSLACLLAGWLACLLAGCLACLLACSLARSLAALLPWHTSLRELSREKKIPGEEEKNSPLKWGTVIHQQIYIGRF